MWRNFGWTAILATWTIFLILNSGLAGERVFNNPRISDEHTSYKVQRTMSRAFDGKTTDRFALQRIKEDFKSNDRSSMRAKAVSPKCKNTENSDLRLSDCEKSNAVMSNAVTAPKHFKDSDGKNVRSTTEGTVTKNARLSKLTVKKLWNTRNYRKFGSNAGVSGFPKLKAEIRHKKLTTYVLSSERKRVIRRDIREEFDRKKSEWGKRRERRRIDNKHEPITFRFFDEFPKRSPSEKNDRDVRKMQNLDTSRQFETMENTKFRKVDVMRERNKNEGDSQSLESTRNGASNKLTYAKNESQTLKITLPSYSNLKADQSRENVEAIMSVTDSAIAEDSTYDRSANVAWTTLIADFEISNANGEVVDDENAISSYHFLKDEDPRSYKPLDEFPTIIAYKLRGYSERGFKVKYSDVREDRKENGNNVNSFTFHVGNPRDIHLAGTKISFAKRSFPRKEEHALARDVFGSRRAYRSSSNNIHGETSNSETKENLSGSRPKRRRDAERMITDVDYATRDTTRAERDPLSNLSTGRIDETKLDTYTERISVTREKNPMHVQHVELDADCERSRTTDFEAEVRGAFRTSLRNVSGLSSMSKFGRDFSGRKNHNRVKYSANFGAIDNTAPIRVPVTRSDEKSRLDEGSAKTSIVSEFASSDVTNVSDDSEGVRKINELTQFTNTFTNKFKLENVRDKSTSRRENGRGARQESKIYSPNGDVRNSKYRRNKRHEVRDTLGNFAPTRLGSETWKTLDTTPATTTANLLIKFNASPSVSATQPNNADQTSSDTRTFLTTTETLPFSLYQTQNTWRSSPLIESGDHERHTRAPMGTDFGDLNLSSEISPLNAPKTVNASSRETTLPISQVMLERSTAIAGADNFVTPDPSNGNVFDLADKKVFTMSSIEAINSHEEHGAEHGFMSTIDPVSQRSGLASRDVLANDSSTTDDVLLEQWPVKHSAVVEGDLVLGGLMMVHEREDNITCGPVMPQGGVQALEAMLYTLDTINDRGIVPGVKIGAHILDDCDKDTYGLEMAVDFIKGKYNVLIATVWRIIMHICMQITAYISLHSKYCVCVHDV